MHPFSDPTTTKLIHDRVIHEILAGRRSGHEARSLGLLTGVRKLTRRVLIAIARRIDPAPGLPLPIPLVEPHETACDPAA